MIVPCRISVPRLTALVGMAVAIAAWRPGAAAADTFTVDPGGAGTHTTIQAAIDAAADGDEIVVRPAVYLERINFSGKAVHVRSLDPADPAVVAATIVDGQDLGRVVTFASGEPAGAVLEGFTITNGSDAGPDGGAGIYCTNAARPTIRRNRILANYCVLHGAGIHSSGGARPLITQNEIRNNVSEGRGGGIYVAGSAAQIVGNAIEGNMAGCSAGGGVYLGGGADSALLLDNLIAENSATFGGGIQTEGCSPHIERNRIIRNIGNPRGGGLSCVAGQPQIIGNVIAGNRAAIAAALECNHSSPLLQSNTIVGNQADQAAIILAIDGATLNLAGNIIAHHPSATAIALHAVAPATILADYCCFFGNAGGDSAGPVTLGVHNVLADPLLVNPGQWTNAPVVGPICGGQIVFFATLNGPGPPTGDVAYRFDPVAASFRVDIDGFEPGTYSVSANSTVVGQVTADSRGRGSLRYDTVDGTWPADFPALSLGDIVDVGGMAAGMLQTAALVYPTSFQHGDLHLHANSPCIDAFAGDVGAQDIDGQPRQSGAAVDIGADEFMEIGDGDGDGDFDLHDLILLQACLGHGDLSLPPACFAFDANTDQIIDLRDWTPLSNMVSGPR